MISQMKKKLYNSQVFHEVNLNHIQSLLANKKYKDALFLSEKHSVLYPNIIQYKKSCAFCYSALGELVKSKELWLELINNDPFHEESLINLADVELKLGRIDSAIGLLKLSSEYHPESIKSYLNMGGAYLLKGDFNAAFNVSLKAVNVDPKNPDAFQNLGSSFFNLGMFNEAKHAFDTALILNPNLQEPLISLSMILIKQDRHEKAITILEDLINKHKSSDRISLDQLKWDSSLVYLRLGNLIKGFEYYECGMSLEVRGHLIRRPSRTFKLPRWTRKSSKDLPVLVWREQGVGDEILFLTCLADLILDGFSPIIETDKRLVNIFKNSFPKCVIREACFRIEYPHDPFHNDFGSHIPMGSLMYFYRKKYEDFPNKSAYLIPDSKLISKWNKRFSIFNKNKKLVGISWKGGLNDPLRNSKYTKLIDWELILNNPNFEFINLQYGDCKEEIHEVESALGVSIHCWDDLDLKNDFDDIFALLKNLDYVVSVSTAIWMFAASVGTPTIVLLHTPHWTMFDKNYSPFFPDVKCLVTNRNQPINELLPTAISIINQQ